MKITLLGLGGWISNPWLEYVSILVESGNDKYLIDAGEGVYKVLRRSLKIDINELTGIIITHAHGDHILGLPTIFLWAYYRGWHVKVMALSNVVNDIKQLVKAVHMEKTLSCVEFIEFSSSSEPIKIYETESSEIYAASTNHVIESVGIKIIEKSSGKSITYTSDTAPSDNIVKLAMNSDVIIHEVSMSEGFEEHAHKHGHSTIRDALEIARKARCRYLIPVHYYVKEIVIPKHVEVNIILPIPYQEIII